MNDYQRAMATAEAFLKGGGAGGNPIAYWTATPTPVLIAAEPVPTFTPGPPGGYEPIPEILVNKIAFFSDRGGGEEITGIGAGVYVMDPDGSNVTKLTNRAAYDTALARDSWSADQRYRAYVADVLGFQGERVPGIYFRDYLYNVSEQVTYFGKGIAYDPVWSPTQEKIAFVSNDSGDDEIWVINRDGSNPLQLTAGNQAYNAANIGKDTFMAEVNKRPSWSPDGTKIVFWSNRSGHPQIWIMNADGSDQRILNPNPANDWDPVWIKYTDTPPVLP
jgi:Tol biopolymer transport system component